MSMKCAKCGSDIADDDKFCTSCGNSVKSPSSETEEILSSISKTHFENNYKTSKGRLIWGAIVVIFIIIAVANGSSNNSSGTQQIAVSQPTPSQQLNTTNTYNQNEIASLVVNVRCQASATETDSGSGTIFSEGGLILTNLHVVPHVGDEPTAEAVFCFITLPNSSTGMPAGIYLAKPIIIPALSEKYDLAFMQIFASYTGSNGKVYGVYPRKFYFYVDSPNCTSTQPKLGDPLKVYGYPITSGSYNLTITGGVISSFTKDGLILTDAKIDSGNSGGFAVDKDGCFVGVPSAVVKGNFQNLGVIIPVAKINEFGKELKTLLEPASNQPIQ